MEVGSVADIQKYVTASIFDPKDDCSMYLQNVVCTAYLHVWQEQEQHQQ
jgi:hypothetical protein